MSENNEIKEPLNKNNKVPKLRFPEFNDEWNNSIFGDIINVSNKKSKPNKEQIIDIEMDSIESGTGKLIKAYKSNEFSSIKNIFTSNDVLYGKLRPYLKKYFKPHFSGLCSSEFWVLSSVKICQDFLYHFVSTEYFNSETNKTCGTKMPRADWKKISKLDIYYPNLNEQHKISCFLDYIDRKIDVICSKIAILKKYKKGTQKNIFDSSKTKEYLVLKNIVKFENKSKISANSSIENGNYILYKSGQKNGMRNDYSHEGIYIIANDGGMAQFKLTSGKFAYTDHCICFRCQNDEETIVLCNYLQSLEKKITYVGFTGTGLKNIDRQYLGMIRIPKVDNKKIAKSFILIDEAIRNYENILEKLTIIKKLLLKQMFI